MPIQDPFSYSARWDSVGLDCAYCIHFEGPGEWPDIQAVSRCALHKIPLKIELGPNGFKEGEWFCKDFSDNGRAFGDAVKELEKVRNALQDDVLYGAYGNEGILREYSFADLRK